MPESIVVAGERSGTALISVTEMLAVTIAAFLG